MTHPSKRKRGQHRKSKPKRVRRRPSKNAEAKPIREDAFVPQILRNTHDYFVIQKLRATPVGDLAVDRLVRDASQTVPALRAALSNVFFKAAITREMSKATKVQLKNAKSALSRLTQAVENLAKASTDGLDGLRMLLEGPPLDDEKGERELNEFASACWKIKMDVGVAGVALESAVETEEKKSTNAGERRKRLRTLVDALADWWQGTGGSLAPYVQASRRDNDRAVVHGRHGDFLSLAIALFCNVDVFKESEVEAAVTNVHEKRLAQRKS
jgi:hypothetical protein